MSMPVVHHYQDLIMIFNSCFLKKYQTQLVKGGDEPIYIPANDHQPLHTIFFAYGYFSSALHECSHWLIAGKERRQRIDFGYWYEPDGRTPEQQKQFQLAEVKPQAMEWLFSMATRYQFQFSVDNLNGEATETDEFKQAVYQQVLRYCEQGLPSRAQRFFDALCDFYKTPAILSAAYCESVFRMRAHG